MRYCVPQQGQFNKFDINKFDIRNEFMNRRTIELFTVELQ